VEVNATCDIRFSLHNRFAEKRLTEALAELGISNRAVTLAGAAVIGGKHVGQQEFVDAGAEEIRTTFTRFLARHSLAPRPHDLVILDIEPRHIAPGHLGDYCGQEQADLIAGYRCRIEVAREVLGGSGGSGPRLGLYQVIVPDVKGECSEKFERRMWGYLEAGRQGMYDQLDFVCPVLYQRFGPADATPPRLARWTAAATCQGIIGSLALNRANGTRIPLVPLLGLWVFNGGSDSNRNAVSPDSVADQLAIVQRAVGIEAILFWSAWQTRDEMRAAEDPVEPIDIGPFLRSTGALPRPGCPPLTDST
jgi:hypothetical protein